MVSSCLSVGNPQCTRNRPIPLRRLQPEVQADFVEALAAGAVVGEGALYYLPVAGGVVHHGEVGEFVDYDVVNEGWLCHYDAPVQADAAV